MSPTTLTAPPATAQRLAPDDDAFVVVTHQGTRVAEIRPWRTSLQGSRAARLRSRRDR